MHGEVGGSVGESEAWFFALLPLSAPPPPRPRASFLASPTRVVRLSAAAPPPPPLSMGASPAASPQPIHAGFWESGGRLPLVLPASRLRVDASEGYVGGHERDRHERDGSWGGGGEGTVTLPMGAPAGQEPATVPSHAAQKRTKKKNDAGTVGRRWRHEGPAAPPPPTRPPRPTVTVGRATPDGRRGQEGGSHVDERVAPDAAAAALAARAVGPLVAGAARRSDGRPPLTLPPRQPRLAVRSSVCVGAVAPTPVAAAAAGRGGAPQIHIRLPRRDTRSRDGGEASPPYCHVRRWTGPACPIPSNPPSWERCPLPTPHAASDRREVAGKAYDRHPPPPPPAHVYTGTADRFPCPSPTAATLGCRAATGGGSGDARRLYQ